MFVQLWVNLVNSDQRPIGIGSEESFRGFAYRPLLAIPIENDSRWDNAFIPFLPAVVTVVTSIQPAHAKAVY